MAEVTKKARAVLVDGEAFSRSRVDIIIPFHGKYEKVLRLVKSILFATKSNPYQICLVDDCSPNVKFLQEMASLPQVFTTRTPSQLGFGGALEYGFKQTKQPWVLFLHSDCLIEQANWMLNLGRCLLSHKDENVKMVCSRSNNPGVDFIKVEKSEDVEDYVLSEETLPLYCVMCHRELFSHIGGFVKNYPYGWYEDEELSFRMRAHGFKQAVCGNSWVRHEGGATINDLMILNPKAAKIMESNREKCIADMKLVKC